ncbi:CynX/NimT family MFS transporter [Peribacillus frigoritolerans]|uniref:CynX/NimT family MFS transporter n=1 Tax=Peribacillus frigoritolerans TaxID=450367 RepID=UPI002282E05B|nr:MFS transporter [Peribacillus frigoritolerans]MCY8935475.1 MFS transporter [Peribacillus frigoritolerans]
MRKNIWTKKNGSKISMIWIIGILFIAANLRAPITSIGPLISLIREDTGINHTLAGMVTTIPLIAFTIISPAAPLIARRIGMEWTLLYSLLLLIGGLFLRSLSSISALMAGMVLMGIAIAVGNVLLPGIIKLKHPEKAGILTGAYIACMNLSSAIGFGISIPLAIEAGLGWRGSLLCWVILAIATLILWLPQVQGKRGERKEINDKPKASIFSFEMWTSPAAWNITLFMGLQSLPFYILSAWLPDMLGAQGMDQVKSGWMLSINQFTSLPATFITPIVAMRLSNRGILGIFSGLLMTIGTVGIGIGPLSLVPFCMVLIGLGNGMAISFAMIIFGLRTENAQQASDLSGMAQSVGYLLAAIGPVVIGLIHDLTHSWMIPKLVLIFICVLLMISGAWAGQRKPVLKKIRINDDKACM